MNRRAARWLAWSIVGVFVLLATAGLALQFLTGTSYARIGFPILVPMVIAVGLWPVTGALIVSRDPRHPVGWLLNAGLAAAAIDMFALGYSSYAIQAYAGSLPGMGLALVWLKLSGFPFAATALPLMLLLFPDGRLPSPRWRVLAWAAVGTLVLYLLVQAFEPGPVATHSDIYLVNPLGVSRSRWAFLKPLLWIAYGLLALCNAAALASLILRLRRAGPDERQQIKWLLYPAGLFLIFIPLLALGELTANGLILGISIAVGLPAIAGMIIGPTLAVFKYRLYDIDIIANRTLVYGALTACVVGIYALIVGGVGALVQAEGSLLLGLVATGLIAVLFQPLRERLQRAVNRLMFGDRDEPFEALARLGRRLEGIFSPEMVYPTIVETVAQALKLPYAAIAVERGEAFEIMEAYGNINQEPEVYPLIHQGQVVGRLLVGRWSPDENFTAADERLLRGFARQAGAVVHAVQLMADLQRSRQKLVAAREEERLRLRRDLHDGLGPALASVVWQTDSARDLVHSDPSAAVELLGSSIEQAQAALKDIRRLVYGLRPPALDELGLVGALEQASQQHLRTVVTVESRAPLPPLPAAVEVAAYRIVQEALKNAVHHAQAEHCAVRLEIDGGLRLTVRDDGSGLPQGVTPGVGLVSMRERAEELGGTFAIHPRPEGGTEVDVSLPLKTRE